MKRSDLIDSFEHVLGEELAVAMLVSVGLTSVLNSCIVQAFVYDKGSREDHEILRTASKMLSEKGCFVFKGE